MLEADLQRKVAEEIENHRLRVEVELLGYVALETPTADELTALAQRLRDRLRDGDDVIRLRDHQLAIDKQPQPLGGVAQMRRSRAQGICKQTRMDTAQVRGKPPGAMAKQAGAIFTEPQYPAKVGAALARETSLPTATLDPVATGPDAAPLDYYETAMRQNMETLRATLGVQP